MVCLWLICAIVLLQSPTLQGRRESPEEVQSPPAEVVAAAALGLGLYFTPVKKGEAWRVTGDQYSVSPVAPSTEAASAGNNVLLPGNQAQWYRLDGIFPQHALSNMIHAHIVSPRAPPTWPGSTSVALR